MELRERVTRRKLLKTAVVSSLAVGLGGITDPDIRPRQALAATAPRAKRGGVLIVGRTADPPNLEPQKNIAVARARISFLLYSNLVAVNYDVKYVPDLAERWENPNPTTWVFHLRKGVKFHSGRELVADDVKFTIDRIHDPKTGSPGFGLFVSVDSVQTPDKYTVKILTKEPYAGLIPALANRFGHIIPPEFADKLDRTAVGTGPYSLEEWIPNQSMKLKRNPDYWDRDKPLLDGIHFQVIPDEPTMIDALRAGRIDYTLLEDDRNYGLVQRDPKLNVLRTPRLGYNIVNINTLRKPFDNVKVRQAMSYGINRQEILQVTFAGLGEVTGFFVPELKDWALPISEFPSYRTDKRKAKQLLLEAGYPTGFKTTLQVIVGFPQQASAAQVIASQLRDIGIEINIESLEYGVWNSRVNRVKDKDFDLTMNFYQGFVDPAEFVYSFWHSNGVNYQGWKEPEVDALVEKGLATINAVERRGIFNKLQRVLEDRVPQLSLCTWDLVNVLQKSVRDFRPHPTGFFFGLKDCWLDR